MTEALSHRGPDDGGLLIAPDLLLGHRRLAILDLSDRGHQPMASDDGQYWIAYNGEVYNFPSLRQELESLGHTFRSHTDTEVVLRGYMQWGPQVVHRLNGMFAFALWDRPRRRLWLVRDPLGIKPLFYYDDGATLRFGSEIKAILADRAVPRELDLEGLDAFLTFGYVAAPRTGFRDIRQLLPGEWLFAGKDGVQLHRWYRLPYPDLAPRGRQTDAVERLDAVLQRAVGRQMISDVPLGALLSGGIDSSVLVRAMCRQNQREVRTFTVRFAEKAFDESPHAAVVAERFRTRHTCDVVRADAARLLPILVSHAEEPFADNSMLPFYMLAAGVSQRVKVALSGDGADELLGGYETYRASLWAPYFRILPPFVRRASARIADRLPVSRAKYGWPNVLRRFLLGANEPALRDHASWRRIVFPDLRRRLVTEHFQQEARSDPIDQYAASADDAPDWLDATGRHLHMDLRFHLPNDMLVKVDRMSMAHSLEVRVPFLDLEVTEACLALAPHWKRQGRRGKIVLRSLLAADLPPSVVERRKSGFLTPLEAWMRSDWQPILRRWLTPSFADEIGVLRWPVINDLIEAQAAGRGDFAYPLFALLILSIWWRIWITEEVPVTRREHSARPTRIHRLPDEAPS